MAEEKTAGKAKAEKEKKMEGQELFICCIFKKMQE